MAATVYGIYDSVIEIKREHISKVCEGVTQEQYDPSVTDIDRGSLIFSFDNLEDACRKLTGLASIVTYEPYHNIYIVEEYYIARIEYGDDGEEEEFVNTHRYSQFPTYKVDYRNGIEISYIKGIYSLDEVKFEVDTGINYTQRDIVISELVWRSYGRGERAEYKPILKRKWWGVAPTEEVKNNEDIVEVGDGYYSEWEEMDSGWED